MKFSKLKWDVENYCQLIGFFALDASEQCELIPNQTEPKYASFNRGDDCFSHPLEVLWESLYEASTCVGIYIGESGYTFIAEDLHFDLADVLMAMDYSRREGMFELSALDWPAWNDLRAMTREIYSALDKEHRLPLGDWQDFYG